MTTAPYDRYRGIGLAGGSLWLIAVGTVFASWSLLAARSTRATALLAVLFSIAIGLTIFGIAMIRSAIRSPHAAIAHPAEGRRIRRQFGIIVAAEAICCAAVNIVCVAEHHWRFIVPLTLIIVGIHFLPLANLFAVPRYYATGALFCAIPIVTMLLIPASTHIGHSLSWIVLPSVGCAAVALITAWAGLNEVRRFLDESRAHLA
jgi:hypothetical protein